MERARRLIRNWLPVVVWLGIIAFESTGTMSSENTGSILYSILLAISGHVTPHFVAMLNAVLRKCGHFIGYAVLSLLVFRAVRITLERTVALRAAAIAVLFTAVVASLDEWHQTLLPNRTGALRDVVLDSFGAICMQVLILAFLRARSMAISGD